MPSFAGIPILLNALIAAALVAGSAQAQPSFAPERLPLSMALETEAGSYRLEGTMDLEAADYAAGTPMLLGDFAGQLASPDGVSQPVHENAMLLVLLGAGPDAACVELNVELTGAYQYTRARVLAANGTLWLADAEPALRQALCAFARDIPADPRPPEASITIINDLLR